MFAGKVTQEDEDIVRQVRIPYVTLLLTNSLSFLTQWTSLPFRLAPLVAAAEELQEIHA